MNYAELIRSLKIFGAYAFAVGATLALVVVYVVTR